MATKVREKYQGLSRANLMKAAELALGTGSFMKNLCFEVTPDLVVDSIIGANVLGVTYRL